MTRVVHLGGRLVPEEEARISPFDRGFLVGDAVFETLRAYGGIPFGLEAHLARLEASCRVTGIPFPSGLPGAVEETLRANGLEEAAVRITVSRGPGGRGTSPQGAGPPTVLVTAVPVQVPVETYSRGLRLVTARRRRIPPESLPPQVKSTNYLVHVLARMEAEAAGGDDALFVDEEGFVVEATQANVFVLHGKRLATPPLSSGCLPGHTRAVVLSLAAAEDLEAREAPLRREDILGADEVFLTGSVTEVAPVASLDGHPVGRGMPGPWTRRLHDAYRALVRGKAGARG